MQKLLESHTYVTQLLFQVAPHLGLRLRGGAVVGLVVRVRGHPRPRAAGVPHRDPAQPVPRQLHQ